MEDALHRFFPKEDGHPEIIYKAMHHSLFSGGKRFRSVLTLLVAETFGVAAKDVLPTACAIEFVHTYSLIHDDLPAIDNDHLRRGKPTCHVLFGDDIAILAGDALFAEAFYLIASEQRSEDSLNVIRVINEVASASGVRGMVSGQVADVQASTQKVDSKTLNFIHTQKTGQLITAAARAGAILAGASSSSLESITRYAYHLGLAFQITDDILDVVGDPQLMGKEVGGDKRNDKATFPAVFGLDASRKKAEIAVGDAIDALAGVALDTKPLKELARFVYEREQ